MRKLSLMSMMLLLVSAGFAQTAPRVDSVYYKNHFYINPFDLFFRTFTVTYERDIIPNKNSIVFFGGVLLEKSDMKMETGFNTEFHYRINVFDYKTNKRGLVSNIFFSPYAQFRYVDHQEEYNYYYDPNISSGPPKSNIQSYKANVKSYGAGVVMGIKTAAFNNRFCFAFYGGGGVKYSDANGHSMIFGTSMVEENFTGITPKFGLQMGLSF